MGKGGYVVTPPLSTLPPQPEEGGGYYVVPRPEQGVR